MLCYSSSLEVPGIMSVQLPDSTQQIKTTSFEEFLKDSLGDQTQNIISKAGVKPAQIIQHKILSDGSLDNNKVVQVILQHPKTPHQDYSLSPAQILFH